MVIPEDRSLFTPIDIEWKHAIERKFNLSVLSAYGLTQLGLYPLNVAKTRMQVGLKSERTSIVLTKLYRESGFKSLYKGFGTTVSTTVPAKLIYYGSVDSMQRIMRYMMKDLPIEKKYTVAVADEVGAMAATMISQIISTPGDIVRKTMMVGGYEGMVKHKSPLDLISKIVKTNGVRGLYKGYSIPFIAFSPSNMIWWGTYNITQDLVTRSFAHDNTTWRKSTYIQAAGGFLAGGMACSFNHPFDTISTRLQVNHQFKKTNIEIAKEIMKEHGVRGFFKGIRPRLLCLSLTGAGYTLISEYFNLVNLV